MKDITISLQKMKEVAAETYSLNLDKPTSWSPLSKSIHPTSSYPVEPLQMPESVSP